MTATPYRPAARPAAESVEALRARIPGWGADLDPADRPSVPQELPVRPVEGAHWKVPEEQPEHWPRERSVEHARLTPVFGTSCPPYGLSGAIRKLAYARYSEGRAAHWLLLLAADRADSKEQAVRSFLTFRPDNPITETGVISEFRRHGVASRLGKGRVDVGHHLLDPLVVGLPWIATSWVGYRVARKLLRRRSRSDLRP